MTEIQIRNGRRRLYGAVFVDGGWRSTRTASPVDSTAEARSARSRRTGVKMPHKMTHTQMRAWSAKRLREADLATTSSTFRRRSSASAVTEIRSRRNQKASDAAVLAHADLAEKRDRQRAACAAMALLASMR